MHVSAYIYMSKLARHAAIKELVAAHPVASQDELRRLLYKRGHRVTQATLSREVHELGLVKSGEGYGLAGGEEAGDTWLPSVERLIREFVYDARAAQNLVIVKTSAGSAQPVAAAIDAEQWPEVVGTVGGDDTIMVVAPDHKRAHLLVERVRELIA
jgi:transcriptional regulator of arginine metabolism